MPAETDFLLLPDSVDERGPASAWISVRRGKTRWDLQSGFAHWLDENGEFPVSQWQAEGRAAIVKTGPHRAVYHLTLPEGNFYLKHYRTPDWQAVLQNLIRPSKADLEWRAATKAAQIGLDTFETVAVGRKWFCGAVLENYLLSREIENTLPLDRFVLETFDTLDPARQRILRREIARQLGRITARLHQHGFLHRDFHPGNLLIRTEGESAKLFLIDLHAMSRKRKLSFLQIARNVSLLSNFFYRLSSMTDRLRFLESYTETRNPGHAVSGKYAQKLDRICREELAKADRRGDQKWRRGNRRLIILEETANHCRGLAGLGKDALEYYRDRPEDLFEGENFLARRNRQARREGVIELRWDGQPQRAIVKTFPQDGRARKAWEMGHALVRRRLPAPRPLLFVESSSELTDYFVTEEIPVAVSLKNWLLEKRVQSTVSGMALAAGAVDSHDGRRAPNGPDFEYHPPPGRVARNERGGGHSGWNCQHMHGTPRVSPPRPLGRPTLPREGKASAIGRAAIRSATHRFMLKYIIDNAAKLLRRLHDYGFDPGDFTVSSLLVREEDGDIRLWFVASETLEQTERIGSSQVIRTMASFLNSLLGNVDISRTDSLRFLRSYLGRSRFQAEWKTYWRRIAEISTEADEREAA